MNHHVVVEIERSLSIEELVHRDYFGRTISQVEPCWTILYKVPAEREDLEEEALSFKGCLVWIENNKVEGSKYAVVKMYLIP